MDEASIDKLTEEIYARVLYFRKFHIQPLVDRRTGQFVHRELGRTLQQELQGYVIFLH